MSAPRMVVVTNKPLEKKLGNLDNPKYKVCQQIAECIGTIFRKIYKDAAFNSNIGMLNYKEGEKEPLNNHLLISLSGSDIIINQIAQQIKKDGDWQDNIKEWKEVVGNIELVDISSFEHENYRLGGDTIAKDYGYDSARNLIDTYRICSIPGAIKTHSDKVKEIAQNSFIISDEKPPKLYFKESKDTTKPIELIEPQRQMLRKFLDSKIQTEEVQTMIRDNVNHTHCYKCCEPKLAAEREKRMLISKNFIDEGEIYFCSSAKYNSVTPYGYSRFQEFERGEHILEDKNTILLNLNPTTSSPSINVLASILDSKTREYEISDREVIQNPDKKIVSFLKEDQPKQRGRANRPDIINLVINNLNEESKNLSPICKHHIQLSQGGAIIPISVSSCRECQKRQLAFRTIPSTIQNDIPRPLSSPSTIPLNFERKEIKASPFIKAAVQKFFEENKKENIKDDERKSPTLWAKAMSIDPHVITEDENKICLNHMSVMWFDQQAEFYFEKWKSKNDKLQLENAMGCYTQVIHRFKSCDDFTLDRLGYYYAQRAFARLLINPNDSKLRQDWEQACNLWPSCINEKYYAQVRSQVERTEVLHIPPTTISTITSSSDSSSISSSSHQSSSSSTSYHSSSTSTPSQSSMFKKQPDYSYDSNMNAFKGPLINKLEGILKNELNTTEDSIKQFSGYFDDFKKEKKQGDKDEILNQFIKNANVLKKQAEFKQLFEDYNYWDSISKFLRTKQQSSSPNPPPAP